MPRFVVDVQNQPRHRCNDAAEALAYGMKHVYLSPSEAPKMLERLARGKSAAWSYGFASVEIAPAAGSESSESSTSFEQAKAEGAALEKEVDAAGEPLGRYPRGPTGLVSEDVRRSPEYRAAKDRYQRAFARLQKFNAAFTKRFAKEMRAERTKRDADRQKRHGV